MSRPSRPLSKSAKLAIASDVVKHLGDLEVAADSYVGDKALYEILTSKPQGMLLPDGTTEFSLTPKQIWTRSASSHVKIELMQIIKRAGDAFQGAGAGLSSLFPGLPLTLGFDFDKPVRFWLALGNESESAKPLDRVINTTRLRWKAPLVRLSNLLESSEFHEIEERGIWHFPTGFPETGSTFVRRVHSNVVTARCITEAMRLASFMINTGTATPEPHKVRSPLVFKLGAMTEASAILLAYEDARKVREVEINPAMEALRHQLSTPLAQLDAAIDALQAEYRGELHLDLVGNDVQFDAENHPLAAQVDLASAGVRRIAIEKAARPICAALSREVLRFHPDARQAEVVVKISSSMRDEPASRFWSACIDGLDRSASSANLHGLIRDAAWTAWAHRPGPLRSFILSNPPEQGVIPINISSPTVLVQAVSPEHAWLLHQDRHNTEKLMQTNIVIHEIHPVSRSDFEHESHEVCQRIEKSYKYKPG